MAYGNYFPMTYQPNYYGNPYQPQPQMMQQQRVQQPTIQQSGFVLVPSEQEARNYPVAPGNSVTFKDENAPYCYVKTMGFNQLDRPTFERYRLVKEEMPSETPTTGENAETGKNTDYATKGDLAAIWKELNAIKEKVKAETEVSENENE